MRTFCLTSAKMEGNFLFTYNELGLMVAFDLEGEVTEKQLRYILPRLPIIMEKLEEYKKIPGTKIIERIFEPTFENFYDRYANKNGKKAALRAWSKMTASEQLKAYNHITKYKMTLKPGIEMKYPATYLNAEPWND